MECACLTEGPITRQLLKMSWPLFLSGFLQSLYGIVDMMMIGQAMGSAGLSAVSMGSQVMQMIIAFSIGLSTGGSVLISHNIIRADHKELRRILGTLTSLFVVVSVVLTALLVAFRIPMLLLFQTPQGALAEASHYLGICGAGILPIFSYNIISAILRSIGNTQFCFVMALLSVALNIGLDWIFVFPLGMGAAGAALATVLAQCVAAAGALLYLVRKYSTILPHKWDEFHFHREYLRLLLQVGIPAGAQPMVVFLSMLIVAGMINGYGLTVSAAYGACMKVDSFSTLPRQAVAQASSVMVGQCFGVGDHKRISQVVKNAVITNFVACAAIGVLVWTLAPQLVCLFDADPAVVAEGSRYLRISAWGYPITGLMGAFNSLTTGIGFTAFSLGASCLDSILARLLFCKLFSIPLGLDGIYLGLALAPVCAALLAGLYFFLGHWRERKVYTSKEQQAQGQNNNGTE